MKEFTNFVSAEEGLGGVNRVRKTVICNGRKAPIVIKIKVFHKNSRGRHVGEKYILEEKRTPENLLKKTM